MDVAFIAPRALSAYSSLGDYFFILPQNASDWYADRSQFKMLDNGAYESESVSLDELLKLARIVKANEVVIPDVIHGAHKTLVNAKWWTTTVHLDGYQVAVVPQGNDAYEFIDCYKAMLKLSFINTICIPKWLGKLRPYVIRYLENQRLLKHQYEYHLFGLDYIEELYCYRALKVPIRSVDTSMPFTCAYHSYKCDVFKTELANDRQVLSRIPWNTTEFTDEQTKIATENCKVIKDVAKSI